MPRRPITPIRILSDELLELACRADEMADCTARRVAQAPLSAADHYELAKLFRYCTGLVRAAITVQERLAPYLLEDAAPVPSRAARKAA